jgi:hypothetical protein
MISIHKQYNILLPFYLSNLRSDINGFISLSNLGQNKMIRIVNIKANLEPIFVIENEGVSMWDQV